MSAAATTGIYLPIYQQITLPLLAEGLRDPTYSSKPVTVEEEITLSLLAGGLRGGAPHFGLYTFFLYDPSS